MLLDVRYQDGKDALRFVLGGFVVARTGDYTLRIAPPGGADWLDRDGQMIELRFLQALPPAVVVTPGPKLVEPVAEPEPWLPS